MATLVGQLGLGDFLSGQRGEADTITAGAEPMSGRDSSGILGGEGVGTENCVRGNAAEMTQSSRDGGDLLFGGEDSGVNLLEGLNSDTFRLVVGRAGNDHVLGRAHSGNGNDLIEMRNLGLPWKPWDFDDLSTVRTTGGCRIILGGSSITVLGVGDLTGEMSSSVPIRSGTTCCLTEPRDHVA